MSRRKPQGQIPPAVRPELRRLVIGMTDAGFPTTRVVDAIASTYNVTRSNVWKATQLRGGRNAKSRTVTTPVEAYGSATP